MPARVTGSPKIPAHKPVSPAVPKPPARPAAPGATFTPAAPTSGPAASGTTAASTPTLALIDGARQRLYLSVDDLNDNALQDHLVAAAKRGVDVHVVLTPKAPLTPEGTMVVLRLTDDGIDVAARKSSKLAAGAGLADQSSFSPGRADPVVGPGTLKTSTKAADVAAALEAFQAELVPTLHGGAAPALLAPEQVKLYQQPQSTAQPILSALNAATKSIDLEVYQVGDPSVTAALLAAAKRGVKVRVMLEPKTVGSSNYEQVKAVLTAGGITVKPTPPQFDSAHNVDHAKFLLVDKKELLLGSGNLVRYGLGGNQVEAANSRDFWVGDTRAQSLDDAAALFEADWARAPTQSSQFKNLVVTPDNARSQIFKTIDAAQKTLFVYNQSLSDADTIQRLIAAKQRGVDVKVLLGVQPVPGVGPKNAPAVKALRAAGIDCKYLTRSYLHAKGIVSEKQAFVGSQNFTSGGLSNNREVGEVLDDAAFVADAQAQFLADFKSPGPQP